MPPNGKTNKRGAFRRPLLGLVSWWKGRKFYFAQQQEDIDDTSTRTEDKEELMEGLEQVAGHMRRPEATQLTRSPTQQHVRFPLTRTSTVDSLQDSIESMDSVAESYWDPADETSETTTPASNTGYKPDFLIEHLGFLSAQTQPREVEVVYRN